MQVSLSGLRIPNAAGIVLALKVGRQLILHSHTHVHTLMHTLKAWMATLTRALSCALTLTHQRQTQHPLHASQPGAQQSAQPADPRGAGSGSGCGLVVDGQQVQRPAVSAAQRHHPRYRRRCE